MHMLHVTHLLHILYWIKIWTPAYMIIRSLNKRALGNESKPNLEPDPILYIKLP